MADADFSELNTVAVQLDNVPRDVRRRMSAAVRKTAYDIVGTAMRFVPVDTGATRSSIYASPPGGSQLGPESLEAEIGPTTHYAPYLEFGTSRMAPHAFMGPALDRHAPGFVEALAEIAGDILP